ncbi:MULTISPECIES: maleylpyruvate isomerase family mycothiol-dependent enzyme [Streptomyces]|uniref:Mycothiol-dependent maleylpyruvate isomerase n=1 Tax=Streptomyces albus (strain ATCC 21838 / DSM 41398 / FERM P-419 / JCM 4703 / NBRC 107858) TaxID=1081613 RepID=A0A0B5F7B8_STRA4|nr:maleylpyruvate isomerase family mycothiol-dependent enzyme [Streptomyces sp. SCSIO ZS0520]AJE86322.1 mycothiol-dependent maleylpyruvate isomerase [Streptomyces albus]AOU80624.1 mycothiol-dependent maleylpyruvate isomerase [Streptomyces albus]AYN36335.1 maleylpyruvate isomerase family mycothiol-dependent enzyme [Streptomyces albus]
MNDHGRDLLSVREATERLLNAAAKLDNAAPAGPSRLPGWSRGHVLAHLARNADALVNALSGRPMYPSPETRDAEIAAGAGRDLETQITDIRESAARFWELCQAPADWSRTVELRNGISDTASRIPFRRLVEVELHHVDLDIGYELEDLPAEFAQQEIRFLAERFRVFGSVPRVLIRQEDGRTLTTGQGEEVTVTVAGTQAELLGWLAGRRPGTALTVSGGELPALPSL